MDDPVFEMPYWRDVARHAVPSLIEATVIPLGLFYGALWAFGLWGALASALLWSFAAILRRVICRQRIPGLLLLGALGLVARTAMVAATGSVFLYFLQPSLTTVLVAGAFLVSALANRPLAERLAHDFCPIPDHFLTRPGVRRLFGRITLLWAFVQLANAAGAVTLLLTQPVGTYVAARAVLSWVLTAGGVAASVVYFKRSLRRLGIAWRIKPATA